MFVYILYQYRTTARLKRAHPMKTSRTQTSITTIIRERNCCGGEFFRFIILVDRYHALLHVKMYLLVGSYKSLICYEISPISDDRK